uniref:Uncharacterized protein n=1 Tax=Anopheles maculatus TaxID=74869 RepID=A0A182SKN9_9DIPT
MQSTSSTISTTSGVTGIGEERQHQQQQQQQQHAHQLVDCLKSIDHTLMGEKKIRYKISCSFKSLDSNCKSLYNFLRGKGTANGVAPAKSMSVSGDCEADTAPAANALVEHHQPHGHGIRMLLNRKLFSDRRDSVLLAPCINVAES